MLQWHSDVRTLGPPLLSLEFPLMVPQLQAPRPQPAALKGRQEEGEGGLLMGLCLGGKIFAWSPWWISGELSLVPWA